jgi:hypothetical protein
MIKGLATAHGAFAKICKTWFHSVGSKRISFIEATAMIDVGP